MPGSNCAFYGCSTSRKHKLSLFRIPTVAASDSDHTKSLKQNARAEWLRLILRTRESTPELQKRIDANNIYILARANEAFTVIQNGKKIPPTSDTICSFYP